MMPLLERYKNEVNFIIIIIIIIIIRLNKLSLLTTSGSSYSASHCLRTGSLGVCHVIVEHVILVVIAGMVIVGCSARVDMVIVTMRCCQGRGLCRWFLRCWFWCRLKNCHR